MKTWHVTVAVQAPTARVAGRSIQRRLKGAPARRQACVVKVQDEDGGEPAWRPSMEAPR